MEYEPTTLNNRCVKRDDDTVLAQELSHLEELESGREKSLLSVHFF